MTDIPPQDGWTPSETTIHVHLTHDEQAKPRWDFTWIQFARNAKALLVTVVTAPWWGSALRDVRIEQSLGGALFMAGAAFAGAVWFDHVRQRFVTRVLVWTTVTGSVGALPVVPAIVHLLTRNPV
jgi:hypothetical protein